VGIFEIEGGPITVSFYHTQKTFRLIKHFLYWKYVEKGVCHPIPELNEPYK